MERPQSMNMGNTLNMMSKYENKHKMVLPDVSPYWPHDTSYHDLSVSTIQTIIKQIYNTFKNKYLKKYPHFTILTIIKT